MQHTALTVMNDEHQAIAAMLRSLSMLIAQARESHRTPDFALLRAMLFYLDEFPERLHHPKETQLLFPRVRARCPELGALIDRLDADHTRGEAAIRGLEHALTAFEILGESRRDAFEHAVQRYSGAYLHHMAVEETQLLPAAREHLSAAEWVELDAAFATHRDPMAGHPAPDEYRALFSRILSMAPAPIGLG
ncbi:MAG: hemerythrin domain-containing protein [Ideonella sp.]|nr:hemerythrin domain-containing protein [Ideonella sp.]MCC7455321.1 hemerythrin domain-containing protein [Nitrospira sp.]